MLFIGLDIGTSSIKCIVFNISTGRIIESISQANSTRIPSANEWEAKQDPEKIFLIIEGILSKVSSKYEEIAGIGISGQMHGILYVSNRGQAISDLFTWQDGRGNLIIEDEITYAKKASEIVSRPLYTGYGIITHYFNARNKIVPQDAAYICTIYDYVAMRLCRKKKPITDYTSADSIGCFDKEKLQFDITGLRNLGIKPALLPELVPIATKCGYTESGIQVTVGIGDNQASYLGSVAAPDKSIHMTIGTSGQISVLSEDYEEIRGLDIRPYIDGKYLLVGASLCGGKAIEILSEFFRKCCDVFCGQSPRGMYSRMNQIEMPVGNISPLIVNTQFLGSRNHGHDFGSIKNITADNLTPQNMINGFYVGVVSELYSLFSRLPPKLARGKSILIGSGSAIRKNRNLREFCERMFKLEMKMPVYGNESAYGAALLSIIGIRRIEKLEDIWAYISYQKRKGIVHDQESESSSNDNNRKNRISRSSIARARTR